MAGKLRRGPVGVTRGQRLRVGSVQPYALAGQQVVVDRLGQQRMPERVAVCPHRLEDIAVHRCPQHPLEGAAIDADDPRQQVVRHPPARGRGGADRQPRRVVELVESEQQQVGEVGGQRPATQLGRGNELLGEERVALGALHDPADVTLTQRRRMQRPDEGADIRIGQRLELYSRDAGQPRPLSGGGAQRMAPVQVIAAVGHDDRDPVGGLAGEEVAQQLSGRLVGPVHVLDEQQQGCRETQLPECGTHRLEQL